MEILSWINNNSGFVIAIATVLYVIFTALMFWEMYKTRKSEFRPYIIIDFEVNNHIIDIVIQNIGKGAAKDVKFEFKPSLMNVKNKDFSDKGFIKNGFPFFPPGKRFVCFFDSTIGHFEKDKEPPRCEVIITYKNSLTNDNYIEKNIIDLTPHKNREYINFKNIHNVAEELDKIKKELENINKNMKQIKIVKM